jgi:hypothetical protein
MGFLLPLLMAVVCSQPSDSRIQVVELFRAETTDELEVALVDGYPMPWLAEILADTTIPEEDRYWLDCRVRSIIAQELKLCYDINGDMVFLEADRIMPGEGYWRECYVVEPAGPAYLLDEEDHPVRSAGLAGAGFIIDRFGDELGPIAAAQWFTRISRDGHHGVTLSGTAGNFTWTTCNVCFFETDGSFREYPLDPGWAQFTMSQSGLLVAVIDDRGDATYLLIFSGEGDLRYERSVPPSSFNGGAPAISPDDRYVAVSTIASHFSSTPVILFDAATGTELHTWDKLLGNFLQFSPDSRYLCISGVQGGMIVECESGETIWSQYVDSSDYFSFHLPPDLVTGCSCSNKAELISCEWESREANAGSWIALYEPARAESLAVDSDQGEPVLSPNGAFVVVQRYPVGNYEAGIQPSIPCFIGKIVGPD